MKNKKRVIFWIVCIVVFLAGVGFCIFFINDLKKDKSATRGQMSVVEDQYKKFSDQMDLYNDSRNNLYVELFDNTYYDTLYSNDEKFKGMLKEYEKTVDDLTDTVKELDKLCTNVYYPDSSINLKCDEYSNVYEQIVNAFVSDINLYNDNIKSYNGYCEENGNSNYLNSYPTEKKFIDYDKDKRFDGKEE